MYREKSFYESYDNSSEREIMKAIELANKTKSDAEMYAKLAELAYDNKIQTIKNNVQYYKLTMLIEDACDSMEPNQPCSHESFNNVFKSYFGNEVEITNIIAFSFSRIAYEIEFKYGEKNFQLFVPMLERMNSSNATDMNEGKLILWLKNGCICEYISSSYVEDEIVESFKKFVGKE